VVPVGPAGLAGSLPAVRVPAASGVACITVSRQSPSDAGIREVFVQVDGETVAVLRHGEAVTHEVPAGAHRLRAHNTLCWKTRDLVLQPGEHARFRAINRAGWARRRCTSRSSANSARSRRGAFCLLRPQC
jgi:hypothetical protein